LFQIGFRHLRFDARFEKFVDGYLFFEFDQRFCRQRGDGAIGRDLCGSFISFSC